MLGPIRRATCCPIVMQVIGCKQPDQCPNWPEMQLADCSYHNDMRNAICVDIHSDFNGPTVHSLYCAHEKVFTFCYYSTLFTPIKSSRKSPNNFGFPGKNLFRLDKSFLSRTSFKSSQMQYTKCSSIASCFASSN